MPEPDSKSEADLDETRAALAPTLAAAAAILPWVKPKTPRFPPAVAARWQALCSRLAAAWSDRHGEGLAGLRPAIFELYAVALELGDGDCLQLAEALASATDSLDTPEGMSDPRLCAALSATLECLAEEQCLEHLAFPERAQHFAARLLRCAAGKGDLQQRSPILDRLFAGEAGECLERIRMGLAALPPDPYAVKLAASDIAHLAEPLELDAIRSLAGRLVRLLTLRAGESVDLDSEASRSAVLELLAELEKAIAGLA